MTSQNRRAPLLVAEGHGRPLYGDEANTAQQQIQVWVNASVEKGRKKGAKCGRKERRAELNIDRPRERSTGVAAKSKQVEDDIRRAVHW